MRIRFAVTAAILLLAFMMRRSASHVLINRLHGWLLSVVRALTAPTFMALTCREFARLNTNEAFARFWG